MGDRGESGDPIDRLVEAVLASTKYRSICVDLVRSIGGRELAKGRGVQAAVKATKTKLHQVGAVYTDGAEQYDRWLAEVRIAYASGDADAVKAACARVMGHHISTRERLPIREEFFAVTLAGLPPIRSVLDIACGLNPLALPWMPLLAGADYYAYDIFTNMVAFLADYFALPQVQRQAHGHAEVRDVLASCPTQPADVAFMLKAIPCLEQLEKSAGHTLLHGLNARHLLVSFPVRSLGGREKGMLAQYEVRLRQLVADTTWSLTRFEFATELAFLVTK